MIMNDDYYELCLEKIRNINCLNDELKKDNIIIPNDVFCSLFIISKDNYNLQEANPLEIAFIEMSIELDEIELDRDNLIKLLDLATTSKVTKELNKELVMKCFDSFNKKVDEEDKLNINNINKVLESIK